MDIEESRVLPVSTIQTRNEVRRPDGRIDCELDHPSLGWIGFTASPNDVEDHGRQIWAALDTMLTENGQ